MNAIVRSESPAALAREAIRRLAASRVAPTPENFARAYQEASGGGGAVAAGVEPEHVLHQLVQGITTRCPDVSSAQRLQEHVRNRAWNYALNIVNEAVGEALAETARAWPRMLQNLLTQLDASHANWTRARKLGAVQHVLMTPSADDRTREKLEHLMVAWALKPAGAVGVPTAGTASDAAAPDERGQQTAAAVDVSENTASPTGTEDASAEAKAWRMIALTALELHQPADRRQSDASAAATRSPLVERLAKTVGAPGADSLYEIQSACARNQAEIYRQAALRDRLVKLLRLVCQNLALFADDDAWVTGQVTCITELLDAPLDEHVLTEAENSLRLAVQRQSQLRADLDNAKVAVKEMLSSLVNRLANAATSTGDFHERISERVEAIRKADDLPSLSRVVADLLVDTGEIRDYMQQAHGDMSEARENAIQSEERVRALEQELADVSSLVRIDPLTKMLNRRGLDEDFAIEQARAEREGVSLSVALLDIDNFKRLNDTFGHQAGDTVLKELSGLVRGALRPSDTVARYGGEEFAILLPGTTAQGAVNVLLRVQRLLTRAFFLHNDEKILVTFSAGITDFRIGDSQESALRRADAALYAAKMAGKNRVEVG